MEIKYIFRLLLKWLWLIVLIPVLAGGGAYYISAYRTTYIYEAVTTMYIVNSSSDPDARTTTLYDNIISAQNTVRNYGELIKSKSAIEEALDEMGLKGYSTERFSGNINLLFPDRNSFVIGMSVKDTDPKLASDMANKLSEILVDRTGELMQTPIVNILDRAEVPVRPSNDETRRNVSIAIIAGIFFSAVVIFFIEYAGSVIIEDEEDIQKFLKLQPLAAIPDIKYNNGIK